MWTRALAVSLLVVLVSPGCGGDRSPAPPPPGGGDAGDGGAGGSGGSGGGGGDGGTAGGAGGGDQGGGSATPGGSGGGPVGGAVGPVTAADGSVVIERLDPDPECDPLVPSRAPDALTLRPEVRDGAGCGVGVSDGAGNVALATAVLSGIVGWQAFTPAGAPQQAFTATGGTALQGLFAEPEGFQGVHATAVDPASGAGAFQLDVVTFAGDGRPRRTERATPASSERSTVGWDQVEDPQGGTALVHFGSRPGESACAGTVSRFDAGGAPTGSGAFGSGGPCASLVAGVSSLGEALVVESFQGEARLWWIAADGRLAAPPASAGPAATLFPRFGSFRLAPLLDGSLVESQGGVWTRRIPHLGDRAEDAPAWLAARRGFTFRNTRGARGYALLPPPAERSDDCSQRIDLVAPSGRLCGRVTLRGDGAACATSAVDQGWDGTIVQKSPRERCVWRTWPRLLAGE